MQISVFQGRPMETDAKLHIYKETATFDKARLLYEFDMKLRELLFSAIQQIEISLRSKIINKFSLKYGLQFRTYAIRPYGKLDKRWSDVVDLQNQNLCHYGKSR